MTVYDPVRKAPAMLHTGLPVKVTGVVFWGLALIGLLFAFVQLKGLEDDLAQRQLAMVDHFVQEIDRQLSRRHPESFADVLAVVTTTQEDFAIPRVYVQYLGEDYEQGQDPDVLGEGLVSYSRLVEIMDLAHSGPPLQVLLNLSLPSVRQQVQQQRKQYLITMGGAFLLFGFVLQWVLQRMISRPFLQMVHTAEAFSAGKTAVRFDERRADEFGYLGGFINRALDYVTLQQQELREALALVRDSEAALYEEKERAVVTLHSIGDAVITTDPACRVEYFNPLAEQLTGWTLEQARGRPIIDLLHLLDEVTRQPIDNPVELCLAQRGAVTQQEEVILLRPDQGEVEISASAAPIRDRNETILGAVMVFHDVGHTRMLARQLSYQAAHDALTGLYNRREFEQRLQQALEDAQEKGMEHALCYLDLDQFKVVNDVCGHIAGDELLCQLAGVLLGCIRETDVLARLGGDEFGMLLSHCSPGKARRVADDMLASVRAFRFMHQEHSFEIGVSIGVVPVNKSSHSVTELLSAADVACYAAKDGGRNRIHVYEPGDREMQQRRGELSWVSQIGRALEEDRMRLYYQPIVPLGSGSSPVHYEMLVRMIDDQGTTVPPMAFLPAAERYNLMPTLDRWVVSTMLKTFGPGRSGPAQAVYVANLSGQSLSDDGFLAFVLDCLAESALDPCQVCFEITETAAIANLRGATRFIKVLRDHGCSFALDDFGSGLSSFGYLKNLAVDYLKIDGGFVKDMVVDEIDAAMVTAINEIGHVMGIRTIAEFVESEAVLERLRDIGVDYAQGYWIAKPQPIEALLRQTPPTAGLYSVS
jgi:diguanylate cyclase (GGDEF)-like protein/PAS domain S-box-containing protein